MDTILNKLERGCGIGAALSGDSKWAQETMTEARLEIERLREACRIALLHAPSIKLAPERRYCIEVLESALKQ